MAVICPTVTAFDPHEYRAEIERVASFAERLHIDLMDGQFTPTKSPGLDQVWWPEALTADIHLMYRQPMASLDQLIKLRPHLVVIHQEAEVDHADFAARLREHGIRAGLAILQATPVTAVSDLLRSFDHLLIFSGNLGHHGGQADLRLLDKVRGLSQAYPDLEIGWDGGINDHNAPGLAAAGVGVLNVGGFIQKAANPQEAYQKLLAVVN